MVSSRFSSQAGRLFEHFVLTTDVARALRSSVAMALAWVACLLMGHAAAAVLVAGHNLLAATLYDRGSGLVCRLLAAFKS
jgi:hypothetical protein